MCDCHTSDSVDRSKNDTFKWQTALSYTAKLVMHTVIVFACRHILLLMIAKNIINCAQKRGVAQHAVIFVKHFFIRLLGIRAKDML